MLCAGITTYSPLVRANIGPGKKVAVIGMYVPLLPTSGLNPYDDRGIPAVVWDTLGLCGRTLLEPRRMLSPTAPTRQRMRLL